jgi:hypothetical protein
MLPPFIVSVKIRKFNSRESIDTCSFHALRTVRVKLRTILDNISAHPYCLLGVQIGCLSVECHKTRRESKRLYVGWDCFLPHPYGQDRTDRGESQGAERSALLMVLELYFTTQNPVLRHKPPRTHRLRD